MTPVWSPDGMRVDFGSNRDGVVYNLYIKSSSDPRSDAPLLMSTVNRRPTSWSADGTFLLYEAIGDRGNIWVLPLTEARTPFPFLETHG